ncbi:MAG: hypothetical protein KDD34_02930 [Bdellovibrionales bacterium]|nr:hypothetical protein [Bdellovibrionales bacterium]
MDKKTQSKLITCILPKGKAIPLLEALAEKGIRTANFAHARGSDIEDSVKSSKLLPQEDEKEIVTIVAETQELAEELFDFSFEKAEINRKGGGIIYMSSLKYSTPYKVEINN